MIKAVTSDDVDIVDRDQASIGDHTDLSHPEAVLQVSQHAGQCGDIGGVAGEHVMSDRHPVAGAQQSDHDLRTIAAMVTAVAESTRRKAVRWSR